MPLKALAVQAGRRLPARLKKGAFAPFFFFIMPLSSYLKCYSLPSKPGQLVLFSTRKGSISLLPEPVFAALKAGDPAGELTDPLTKLGILVPDRQEERREVLNYIKELNRLSPVLTAAIIPGMACNFACVYCYEGSQKGNKAMTDATADQTIAFLKARFDENRHNKILLDFYGGEPLLYPERIKYFARRLQPFVAEMGGEFQMTLVSNGSLLTRQMVEELLPFGLTAVKITLDGPPESHDRSRPFASGRGSFSRILENLQAVAGLIRIKLGGNFSRENYLAFPALLDHLLAVGLGPEQIGPVQFSAVMPVADEFALPDYNSGCLHSDEEWLPEAAVFLRREIKERGFATPTIRPTACMIEMTDAFVVHYDGTLYKCPALIGHQAHKVGDVWQGFNDYADSHGLANWRQNDKCRNCVYLPLCFGGCRYMTYQRSGSMAGVDCRYEYFEGVLPEMVRQDVMHPKPRLRL